MNWNELTANVTHYFGRLRTRFPHIDEDAMKFVNDRGKLVEHIARQHDLTNFETNQEIDDWLFIEGLARQASELRAG